MKGVCIFFKNLNVSWKFVLAYFAVMTVPLMLAGIYLYIQTSNSVIAQAQILMERNLLQTRDSILQKVNIIENTSQLICYDTEIRTYLSYGYNDGVSKLVDYQFNISPLIQNVLRQNRDIYTISVYMEDLIINEKINSFNSISRQLNSEEFNKLYNSVVVQAGWITTHSAQSSNYSGNTVSNSAHVLSFAGVIYSAYGFYQVGALDFDIREDVLFNMLRDPVVNSLGSVFIVDGNNNIVSNNAPNFLGKNLSSIGLKDFAKDKDINTILSVNNIPSIVISVPIKKIGCSIVGMFPEKNFDKNLKQSIYVIILVLFAFSLLLGLIIYLITNALLSRVKKLVKAIKQVGDNNLNVSIPVGSMDEFGELVLNFNNMTTRINDLVETVYKSKIMEREAELKALEAQINPHFLYNTLATISWVARKANSPEILTLSNSLAKFYRLVLSKGNTEISISEELDMVNSYLKIQKIRFKDLFSVYYEIDEEIGHYKIEKNILQPIVENSLNHGIEPKHSPGTIIIKTFQTEDRLNLQIIDDGIGIDAKTLADILAFKAEKSTGSGYAIKNVMERLKAYYGSEQTFNIFSKPGIGTVVTISIKKPFI